MDALTAMLRKGKVGRSGVIDGEEYACVRRLLEDQRKYSQRPGKEKVM